MFWEYLNDYFWASSCLIDFSFFLFLCLSGVSRMVSCHDFIVCWDFEVWSGFWGGWRGFWGLARGEESKPAWNQLDNQGIALWFVILGRSKSKFLYKILLSSSSPDQVRSLPGLICLMRMVKNKVMLKFGWKVVADAWPRIILSVLIYADALKKHSSSESVLPLAMFLIYF